MSILWTGVELAAATQGRFTGGRFGSGDGRAITASGVSIDTRTLETGDLFIALLGENSDGHAHVALALDKGAAAVLVHRTDELEGVDPADPRLLVVGDTMVGLWDLARAARARFTGDVVAVTGSVGKTTTKEMLRVALGSLGKTHASAASYNNHWGVPLTLARLPRDAVFCVSEIGMNHPGEIAPLAELVRPDVAVISTIGSAHLGHMGSLEAIAQEKASIITALPRGGIAIVPDDAEGQVIFTDIAQASGVTLWKSGFAGTSTARITDLELSGDGSRFVAHVAGTAVSVDIRAPGEHLARNALSTLAVVAALHGGGPELSRAAVALADFTPGTGRGAASPILDGKALLLDESYNASVLSIRAALGVLALLPAKRRIAVLGDIRELGDFAHEEHLSLEPAVSAAADLVFCCGPHMKDLFDALPPSRRGSWEETSSALAPLVRATLQPGDAVLVKGSFGSRMKTVVDALKAENV